MMAPVHLRTVGRSAEMSSPRTLAFPDVWSDQAEQHTHGRCLPGPVGAQKTEDLAALHGQVEVVDRNLVPVRLGQLQDLDPRSTGCRSRHHSAPGAANRPKPWANRPLRSPTVAATSGAMSRCEAAALNWLAIAKAVTSPHPLLR
jgi:hypothetical protein